MKKQIQTILAVMLVLATTPLVQADTTSRFTAQKSHITGLGDYASSGRFQAVDSVVSFSASRAQNNITIEDIGFPAMLAPLPEEEDEPTDPTPPGGGGGGGGRPPFSVFIKPGTRTFGDGGLDVILYSNRGAAYVLYTTDGSDPKGPNAQVLQGQGSIKIFEDTTVRAVAKVNSMYSRRKSEFYDYIETPEEKIDEILLDIKEPPEDLRPAASPAPVAKPVPAVTKGSVEEPLPYFEIRTEHELYAAAPCSPLQTQWNWREIFWMIAFLTMVIVYIEEHRKNRKGGHSIMWHQQRKKL